MPRKKRPGKYAVLVEGKVQVQGDPDPLMVYIPERIPFVSKAEADARALELAKAKPGSPVAVVRYLGSVCVQEVVKATVVRG